MRSKPSSPESVCGTTLQEWAIFIENFLKKFLKSPYFSKNCLLKNERRRMQLFANTKYLARWYAGTKVYRPPGPIAESFFSRHAPVVLRLSRFSTQERTPFNQVGQATKPKPASLAAASCKVQISNSTVSFETRSLFSSWPGLTLYRRVNTPITCAGS